MKSRGGREREKKILASRDGANLPRPAAVRSLSFPFPLERLSPSLSLRPSVLPVPLLRPRAQHAFSVPSDKSISPDFHFYASIPRVCNRDERPRKGYRVTQKTLEIERSTSGRATRRRWIYLSILFSLLADERMRILIARATRKKNKGSKGREERVTKRNGCLGWSNAIEAGFVAKGTIGKEERREKRGAGVLIGRTENCIFEIN